MAKAKKLLMQFPEYYLILLVLLAAYSPPFSFNPIVLLFLVVPILQIVFKNKASGLIIAALFGLVSMYFLVALVSEFNEFSSFNFKAKQLLFTGLFIWLLNMTATSIMIIKYLKADDNSNLSANSIAGNNA